MKKFLLSLFLLLPVFVGAQEKDMKQMNDLVSKFMLTTSEQFTKSLGELAPHITLMLDEEDLEYWSIYSEQKFQEDMKQYVVSHFAKYLTDEDFEQLTKAAENEALVSAMNKASNIGDVFSSSYMQKFLGWYILMLRDPAAAASQKPQVPCSSMYREEAMNFMQSKGMQMQIQMILDHHKEQLSKLEGQLRKIGYSTTDLIQDVYLSIIYEGGVTEQELRKLTVIYNMQGYVHMQQGISELVTKGERMMGYIFKRFYLFEAQEKMKQSK